MGISAGQAMGLQMAGLGASTMGAFKTATAQQNSLNYESAVAANNAQLAQYQASVAQDVGARQEQAQELKNADLYGNQRAMLAANGVSLQSGSPNEILASTKLMGNNDVMTIRDNTARQVWADQVQASNYSTESQADKAIAGSISPFTSAATSLLTGAATVAPTWKKWSDAN
jgi:hypothetical protein